MNHHIRAEGKRLLQVRGRERVVHDGQCAVTMRRRGDGAHVIDLEQRIGQGLEIDGPGGRDAVRAIAPHCGLQGGVIPGIDRFDHKPPTGEELIELRVRSTVDIVTHDDTVAGLEGAEHRMDRSQTGGERKTTLSPFKLGDLPLQEIARGVAAARVIVTGHRVDPLKGICRRIVDRRVHCSGVIVVNRQSMNELSIESGHCAPPYVSRHPCAGLPRATSMTVMQNAGPKTGVAICVGYEAI